jgi:hypothetical protein
VPSILLHPSFRVSLPLFSSSSASSSTIPPSFSRYLSTDGHLNSPPLGYRQQLHHTIINHHTKYPSRPHTSASTPFETSPPPANSPSQLRQQLCASNTRSYSSVNSATGRYASNGVESPGAKKPSSALQLAISGTSRNYTTRSLRGSVGDVSPRSNVERSAKSSTLTGLAEYCSDQMGVGTERGVFCKWIKANCNMTLDEIAQ